MFGVNSWEIVVLVAIFLLLFGPERLPEVIGQVTRLAREFRAVTDAATSELSREFAAMADDVRAAQDDVRSIGGALAGPTSASRAQGDPASRPAVAADGSPTSAGTDASPDSAGPADPHALAHPDAPPTAAGADASPPAAASAAAPALAEPAVPAFGEAPPARSIFHPAEPDAPPGGDLGEPAAGRGRGGEPATCSSDDADAPGEAR